MEPFGDDWRNAGELKAMLFNINRKANAEAKDAEDFMPVKRQEKYQTGQQVLNIFKALGARQQAHGDNPNPDGRP